MRKLLGRPIFVALAAASAIALSAPSALAATWTVSPGGNFSGGLKPGTTASVKDGATNQTFSCSGSTLTGSAPAGTGLSGAGIAHFNGGSLSGCTGALGSTGSGSINSGQFNAVSYSPTTMVVTGTVTSIIVTFTFHDVLGTCTVTAAGDADAQYDDNTGTLTITMHLTVTSVVGAGCAGLIRTGDKITITVIYIFTPVVRFTSP